MFAVDDLRPLFGRAFDSPEQSTTEVKTPNFDKWFLDEGLVFRNSYVQVAVCGPSRSSVLTGRRPDSTRINAQPPNSWCWAQRGYFITIPHYFKQNGYTTAGGGKLFHPDVRASITLSSLLDPPCSCVCARKRLQGCNQWPDPGDGNTWMHPAAFYYGTMGNFTHWEGDDPQAWSLPCAHFSLRISPSHPSSFAILPSNMTSRFLFVVSGTSRTRTRPSG